MLAAPRSKTWVCGSIFAAIVGLNSTEGTNVCVLCGRGLGGEPVPRPEESYRERERERARVCVCV
jgi:hypothetical protein